MPDPCTHGMPTPAACVDCMTDGNLAPSPRPQQRPWWIPAFLWRRIPLSFMQYQLTTEVYEIFPHAREILPLGKSHVYTTSKIQTTEFPYRKGR